MGSSKNSIYDAMEKIVNIDLTFGLLASNMPDLPKTLNDGVFIKPIIDISDNGRDIYIGRNWD